MTETIARQALDIYARATHQLTDYNVNLPLLHEAAETVVGLVVEAELDHPLWGGDGRTTARIRQLWSEADEVYQARDVACQALLVAVLDAAAAAFRRAEQDFQDAITDVGCRATLTWIRSDGHVVQVAEHPTRPEYLVSLTGERAGAMTHKLAMMEHGTLERLGTLSAPAILRHLELSQGWPLLRTWRDEVT